MKIRKNPKNLVTFLSYNFLWFIRVRLVLIVVRNFFNCYLGNGNSSRIFFLPLTKHGNTGVKICGFIIFQRWASFRKKLLLKSFIFLFLFFLIYATITATTATFYNMFFFFHNSRRYSN